MTLIFHYRVSYSGHFSKPIDWIWWFKVFQIVKPGSQNLNKIDLIAEVFYKNRLLGQHFSGTGRNSILQYIELSFHQKKHYKSINHGNDSKYWTFNWKLKIEILKIKGKPKKRDFIIFPTKSHERSSCPVAQSYLRKIFLKIPQNSQESTHAEASFLLKLQGEVTLYEPKYFASPCLVEKSQFFTFFFKIDLF